MRRGSDPDRVYVQLRDHIVRGRLAPGSRLVEAEIARRFGVSRTPVRAALQRLRQEGYIVDTPSMRQSRPSVAALTREGASEVFELVGLLEGMAARLAAEQAPGQRRQLARSLTSINARFRKAGEARRPDHNRLFLLDEQFHGTVVTAAAGTRLQALHRTVKPQAERFERLYVSFLTGEIATSADEHETIVSAIAEGRPAQAERAVRSNWANAAERLGRVIERAGELGSW